jgi:multiple sugar transport system permease protein
MRLLRKRGAPYLLLAPTMALMLIFLLYPLLSIGYFSLQKYSVIQPWDNGFVGLDNFVTMLGDDLFWTSLGFTAKWVIVEVVLQLLGGLVMALIVNEVFKGRGAARAILFSPWAVSGVLTTTIWLLLYNPAVGINKYLADVGLGHYGTSPLADGNTAFWAAILAELWRGVPFFAILILADLQSISPDLYEASHVDGAGRLRRFWSITLPHLRNAIILATLLRGVWEFNNVDLLYTLTGGGPANATTTLPLYVAKVAIDSKEFGYGSALTVAAFVILSVFTVVYLKSAKFGKED